MGPGNTHHSKKRERGQVSPLWRALCRKQALCPPGTTHCCSALSRATFGKGGQAGCGSAIFFFNPHIDVTLASIHTPASMWGSTCEGYPFGLSGSWLPLTWELNLSRAGNPGQREIPWPLQLAFSKLGCGRGGEAFVCIEMWVILSGDGIPVEKHLGKASFYFLP